MSEQYTLEDLKQLPRIDVWKYFADRLTFHMCSKVCPDQDWYEWKCRGCLVRILSDRGRFYYDMGWVWLLHVFAISLKNNFRAYIADTREQHNERFYPRYSVSEDVFFVFDEKTDTRLPYCDEYYDPVKHQCKMLNKSHDWTSKNIRLDDEEYITYKVEER